MASIAIISFRLGMSDGVSIEAEKWRHAFTLLGHDVRTIAGEGPVDLLIPELAVTSTTTPRRQDVSAALKGADVVVVENLLSLPLNVGASEVVAQVLQGRRAILHHHDLASQRESLRHFGPPPDDPAWRHVTINELSRRELADQSIDAVTMYNSFDLDPLEGQRELTRTALGVASHEWLALIPMRAIGRKNISGAVGAANELGARTWMLGPADDGYQNQLEIDLALATQPVVRARPNFATMSDVYAASDVVVVASSWEGFGNPVLESVAYRRPLLVSSYPVAQEIMAFGFHFFPLADVGRIRGFLRNPDPTIYHANLAIARQHFSLDDLPQRLHELLST